MMKHRLVSLLALGALVAGMLAMSAGPAAATDFEDCDGPEDPANVIIGSRFNDRLVGTDCNDSVFARGGNDVVRGKLGYDVLRGQRGDDRLVDLSFLVGGVLRGGLGWDTCVVAEDSPLQLISCEVIIEVG
jgi:hypothetical protein